VARSSSQDAAASWARRGLSPASTNAFSGSRSIEPRICSAPGDQLVGALGADVLDAPEVDAQRLLVGGRQGVRLRDLDLRSVAGVVHPGSENARALFVLEVTERSHEHDLAARIVDRLHDRPAGLLAGEACAPDCQDRVELGHRGSR
jgi:hypothetical protein